MVKPIKLEGRKNYDSWRVEAKAYLAVKGHWKCFDGTETNEDKNFLAIQSLNLLISSSLYTYTENCTTAKQAWDTIKAAFEDTGIGRRVDLLKQLVGLKQCECESMEEYVHKMMQMSTKVTKAGLQIGDDVVASLMLAGLPDEYRPMVMALENSTKVLTTDLVQNRLLQEVTYDKSNGAEGSALMAKGRFKNKNKKKSSANVICFACDEPGHFANKCPKRKNKSEQLFLSSFVAKSDGAHEWFIDSGASAHMVRNDHNLCNVREPASNDITIGNNSKLNVKCAGDKNIAIGSDTNTVKVTNVLCIPDICANLMSVSQMAKRGNTLVFDKECCKIFDCDKNLIAKAPLIDDLYKLTCLPERNATALVAIDKQLWHRRLGHSCDANLIKVKNAVIGIDFTNNNDEKCVICVKGKQTRESFNNSTNRAAGVLDVVHSDVAFVPNKSFGGAKCFVTFIDDYSRKVFLYPMKHKNEVYDNFHKFKTFVENQTGRTIKILRTDNGTEYVNNKFESLTTKYGIMHQRTVPHTPEQNGVAERMNRTIIEKVRCMLLDSGLNASFWAEAASTAAYLINRIPCRDMVNETPEERWSNVKPDLSSLRIFGCRAMMHVPKVQRKKLDAKSVECLMMGYCEHSKAYRLFNSATKKVIVGRDVVFIEPNANEVNVFTNKTNELSSKDSNDNGSRHINTNNGASNCDSDDNDSDDYDSDDNDSESDADFSEAIIDNNHILANVAPNTDVDENDTTNAIEIDDNTNANAVSSYIDLSEASDGDNSMYSSFTETDFDVAASEVFIVQTPFNNPIESAGARNALGLYAMLAAATNDVCEPKTYDQAIRCEESGKWKNAMVSEFRSLIDNDTWELCTLPPERNAIDCKWVYKIKRNAQGEIDRYKARLVIKGYSQVKGIDYDETYSPVARYSSIRFLLAMAAKFNLIIHQMDAVSAFLQGDLQEEIYMRQPDGTNDNTGRVCRLKRALYGLKQSSRVWNDKLNDVLKNKLKFIRSSIDQCIYFKHSNQNTIILAVWVDDIMIFASNATMCTKLKFDLASHFQMKDLGEAKSLLGMNISHQSDGSISIDQQHYISTVLQRFNMQDCKPASTPLDINEKLSKEMCPKTNAEQQQMAKIPYQEAIGCLMYAAHISRPDICFAVSVLSRYNTNYGPAHWSAVKRVLRYLKGTIELKLTFRHSGFGEMVGYCDADWAGDLDKRRSTTGYVFQAQGGAISWATRSQPTIALSSTEAEFMSMAAAIQEALWLKRFEREIFLEAPSTIVLYCDNQGALHLAKNQNYHARTKHIDVRKYFIQENLHNENNLESDIKMNLLYKPTAEMVADILTKAVNQNKLEKFFPEFGLNM